MVYEDNSLTQNQQVANNQPGLVGASPASNGQAPTTATSTGGTTNQSSSPQNGTNQANSSVQNFNQANRSPSGNFTNIKSYINANASAAPQLGQKIENNVSNSANAIKQGIEKSQNQFQQNAQNVQNQENQGQNFVSQINQDPNQIVGNQAALSQFRQLQNNSIAAPGSTITGQESQPVQQYAQQAGSEQGRFQLLQNMFKNPAKTYSQGQQNLDQLILQGSPNVANQLQSSLKTQAQGLQNQTAQAQQLQQQKINQLSQLGAQNKQDIAKALGSWGSDASGNTPANAGSGALGNLYGQLTTAQKQAQEAEQKQLQDYQSALATGPSAATNETLQKALGINAGTRLLGIDLNQFKDQLQLSNPQLSLADAANQDQANRVAALSQLANQNINLGPKGEAPGVNFAGKQSFDDLLAQRQKDFQAALNPLTSANNGVIDQYTNPYNRQQDLSGKAKSFVDSLSSSNPNFNPDQAQTTYNSFYNSLANAAGAMGGTGTQTGQLLNSKLTALQNLLNQYGGLSGQQVGSVAPNGDQTSVS